MRKLFHALLLVTISTCVPLKAATATDFYAELLRRGIAEVEAGRNETAVTPLRLAAFGLLESVDHYEIAQAYLVVALDRLNETDAAREAALRIVAAERVERRFTSLKLSNDVRNAFIASAKKLLSAAEVAVLLNPQAPPPPAPATTARTTTLTPASQTTTPAQTTAPVTKPAPPKTEDPKPVTKPAPAQVQTQKPAAAQTATAPKPTPPAPKPAPAKPAVDATARLVAGDRALVAANLTEARRIYRELLDAGGHDHATWIRVAEGLYRSRDFGGALTAFQRVGTLRAGEEAYRYYIAVAAFETRQYDRAKRELAAALPHIEMTPDVQRYRTMIENAR